MIQRTPGQSEETETDEAELTGPLTQLSPDGLSPDGLSPDGLSPDGLSPDGLSLTGQSLDGVSLTGESQVPESQVLGTDVEGVALRSSNSGASSFGDANPEETPDEVAEEIAEEIAEDSGEDVPERSEEERATAVALLVPQLEAILFVAREPIRTARFVATLGAAKLDVSAALEDLAKRFSGDQSGVHLVEIAGGWRFLSNPLFADTLAVLHGTKAADRLSPAAMETLAIIAYKQPAGRAEIERIRGVGVGPIVRLLLELDLVRVAGRDDGLGRALMYGTTKSFLDRFGLGSLRDLPANLES